ncbi:Protein M3 [Rhizoctonia solani]
MDAGNHSLRSLEPFLLMAKSAKGAGATKLIADATSAPGTYVFAELLEMPNIQEDVLKGKLDQKEARIEIEYTIGRDLEPGAAGLQVLLSKLREWSNRTSTVIQALDVQIQGIKDNERGAADAAKEYEGERVAMATQIAEQRRQQPRKQVVEDAMATGGGAPSGSSADAQRSTSTRKGTSGGPLILVACIYQLYGLVIAWITRKIFWVPRRFHSGILAAGIWSNWGDLPTAVIMSMTASAPFSPGDSDVAVAYLSAFILVFFVTLFPFGGSRIIEKDFMDKSAPVDADDEIPESASSRLRRRWGRLQIAIQNRRGAVADSDIEGSPASEQDEKVTEIATPKPKLSRHVSFNPSEPTAYNGPDGGQSTRPPSAHVSPAPTVVEGIHNTMSQNPKDSTRVVPVSTETGLASTPEIRSSRFKRALLSTRAFLKSLASPATSSMVVSFIVALVPQLKALFIAPPAGSNIHIHHAPDGLPPLNMIMDTATFIGNASVPLGLICLGSALARLQVPKPISRAPLGAITLFSILKMVVGPVFGVLVVEALTHRTSLIDPKDKVLRFVCIYFAGVPTATTQVYLTQIYSPDGSASHVSAFLIPQYALMFITMTALSAYALNLLF